MRSSSAQRKSGSLINKGEVDLSSHGFIGSESSPSQTSGQFACVRKVDALTDCLFSYGTSLVIQSTDIPSLRSFTVAESECTISCWRMD